MIGREAVEHWLGELDLVPLERADREGVASWDLLLDGRRRHRVRFTIILDPAVALVVWVQFAPPINDAFRKSYRKLLRWNDEFPFVKFTVSEDERPILMTELVPERIGRDAVGLAIARLLALCDRLLEDAGEWLATEPKPGPAASPATSGLPLLERYAESVREIVGDVGRAEARDANEAGDVGADMTGEPDSRPIPLLGAPAPEEPAPSPADGLVSPR